jgi:hypothetical protein
LPRVSVCRQSNCWGEKHVSGFRSVLAQQEAQTARSAPICGGAPKSHRCAADSKVALLFPANRCSAGQGSQVALPGNMLLLRYNRFVFSLRPEAMPRACLHGFAQFAASLFPPLLSIAPSARQAAGSQPPAFQGWRERNQRSRLLFRLL